MTDLDREVQDDVQLPNATNALLISQLQIELVWRNSGRPPAFWLYVFVCPDVLFASDLMLKRYVESFLRSELLVMEYKYAGSAPAVTLH